MNCCRDGLGGESLVVKIEAWRGVSGKEKASLGRGSVREYSEIVS